MIALHVLHRIRLSRPLQWIFLLAAPGALWALWPEPQKSPPLVSAARDNWDGFLAVEYSGIRRNSEGRAISRERFREHLLALSAAGYHPICLEEARSFLRNRAPLPEKALLLILEDGRRDTVQNAEEVLAPLRYPATLFLSLEPMERSSFLYPAWHDLRCLAATGRWTFSSKEPEARAPERLASDLELLEGETPGEEPRPGITPLTPPETGYALNAWGRSHDRLGCLKVDPAWSGEDLAGRLDAQWVRRSASRGSSDLDWVFRFGRLKVEGSRVLLEPSGKSRGAEAWLAGTESWRCLRGRATLECRPGAQSWIYLRGVPGKSFLRLGWTGRRLEVQSRLAGWGSHTVAEGLPPADRSRATISFDLLEKQIRFAVEGGSAPARAFPVPAELATGMAGLGAWLLDEGDRSPLIFEDLVLEPRAARALVVREIAGARSPEPGPIDVLAPRWYEVSLSGNAPRLAGRVDPALRHLAAHRGAMLWPVVSLSSLPREASLASLAAEVDRVASGPGIGGVFLDLGPLRSRPSALEESRLADLLEALSAPVAVFRDPVLERLPPHLREKIARIGVTRTEAGAMRLPPEKLIVFEESPF